MISLEILCQAIKNLCDSFGMLYFVYSNEYFFKYLKKKVYFYIRKNSELIQR